MISPIKMGWESVKPKAVYIGVYRKSFANITKLATTIIWKINSFFQYLVRYIMMNIIIMLKERK